MAPKLTPIQKLYSWTTIYDGKHWFILTDDAREKIEEALVAGGDVGNSTVRLERAKKRNNVNPTGNFQEVYLSNLVVKLQRD